MIGTLMLMVGVVVLAFAMASMWAAPGWAVSQRRFYLTILAAAVGTYLSLAGAAWGPA